MPLYIVSYDLIKNKDYTRIIEALKKHGAHRALESFWLLDVTNSAGEIMNWLKQFVDSDDRLFIAEFNALNAETKARKGTRQWLADCEPVLS